LNEAADILSVATCRDDGARGERSTLREAEAKEEDERDEAGTNPYVEEVRELATTATMATAAELIFIVSIYFQYGPKSGGAGRAAGRAQCEKNGRLKTQRQSRYRIVR
jgi:hypothetical protein